VTNEPPAASAHADLQIEVAALTLLLQAILAEGEQRQRGFADGVRARLPDEASGLVAETAHVALGKAFNR
jgi:hypothetical protein